MNKVNRAKLFLQFPKMYRPGGNQANLTCGDGWFDLVYELSRDIVAVATKAGVAIPEVFEVCHDHGSLRFGIGPVATAITDPVYDLIDWAEHTSELICEGCGIASEINSKVGWQTTLCTSCRQKIIAMYDDFEI